MAAHKGHGDTWKNYFLDVICANAYTFPGNQKYLTFSWDYAGSEISAQFGETDSTYTEHTWTLDSKVYTGVSGGAGVNIFGIGEDMNFQFLVGFNISASTSDKTTNQTSWSIGINSNWGPPGWGDQNSSYAKKYPELWNKKIALYNFLMFFLPAPSAKSGFASNYWADELKRLLRTVKCQNFTAVDEIDGNSGTWKIVFVVTDYATNEDWFNGNKMTYSYTGPLPQSEEHRPADR